MSGALSGRSHDLPNAFELLILQNRKGQSADNTLTPGMGWFFKGLPSGKRVVPIYPMETPNGVRCTVGGRFFPSGSPLAQDFIHKPACQTGDHAPQGRFRHQPEQMVHPPFAWQLASFPSLPVCGEEAPYRPLRDFATLRSYFPEIKAQQVLFAFLPVYPELVGVVGSRLPDYRGRFLRGVQSGHTVGEKAANSLKSHNHTQPAHTHTFSGQLVSTALSGTAGGQSFSSAANLGVSGWAAGQTITGGGAGGQTYQTVQGSGGAWVSISQTGNDSGIAGGRVTVNRTTEENLKSTGWGEWIGGGNTLVAPGVYENRMGNVAGFSVGGSSTTTAITSGGSIWGNTGGGSISGTASGTVSGTGNASSVSGSLRNGVVNGIIGQGGGNSTDYTGEEETAPDHIYVRCLIRAAP